MPIKAFEVTTTDDETSTTFEIEAPDDVKEMIGEYLVEQILAHNAQSKSPVSGHGRYPALSKLYKQTKEESGRPGVPNLDFEGDMNAELDYRITDEGLKIGVFGDSAPKADGHNNLSGRSELPLRRFLPDVGEHFKRDIDSEIEKMLAEARADEQLKKLSSADIRAELDGIESRGEFYEVMSDLLGIDEEYLIRGAVLANPRLRKLIEAEGLLGFLREDA